MLTYACFRARYYISSSFYFFLLFPNTHYMYNSPSDYSLFLLNLLLIQLLSATTLTAVYICYYTKYTQSYAIIQFYLINMLFYNLYQVLF